MNLNRKVNIILGMFLTLAGNVGLTAEYHPEVLRLVQERVQAASQSGKNHVVIFDLDETLINSRTRTLRILRDFAFKPDIDNAFPHESARLIEITGGKDATPKEIQKVIDQKAYEMKSYVLYPADILKELGAYSDAFLAQIKDPYLDAYLSSEYCADDTPMPGAAQYVQSLHSPYTRIVYLTGRNRPGMGAGTEANLKKNGFPLGDEDHATLIMKPRRDMDDTEFKKQALASIGEMGEVVAGFENEPANINAFKKAFPNGTYVFVDNIHTNKPDVPAEGIYWIKDYTKTSLKLNSRVVNSNNIFSTFRFAEGGDQTDLGYCGQFSCNYPDRNYPTPAERVESEMSQFYLFVSEQNPSFSSSAKKSYFQKMLIVLSDSSHELQLSVDRRKETINRMMRILETFDQYRINRDVDFGEAEKESQFIDFMNRLKYALAVCLNS